MYISEYMTSNPVTVGPKLPLPEARRILNEFHFRHLPVVDEENRLIGIITDRDLRSAYPSSVITKGERILAYEQVEKTTVADIMTTSCSSLDLDANLDDALFIFDRDQVGGIPILDKGDKVVGIFSLLDLTSAYTKLFGTAEKNSVLVGVKDDKRENILCEITTLLEKEGIPLTRLLRLDGDAGTAKIYIRINVVDSQHIHKLLLLNDFVLL